MSTIGKATAKPKATTTTAIEVERAQFRTLIASNPNYFGNLKESKFPSVKALSGNTSYEELTCVGFQPQMNQLEAVIRIKRTSGYSGDLCDGGSEEFIRFYTSDDNGATWTDQGLAQFSAYDVAHPKPLDHAVALPFSPRRKFCQSTNILLVRAILSWNSPPPANMPSFTPVWGNVREAKILVAPRRFFKIEDLAEIQLELPKDLPFKLPEVQLEIPDPDPLPPIALKSLYAKSDVPESRFLYPSVAELATSSGFAGTLSQVAAGQAGSLNTQLAELKVDVAALLKALANVGDGNQTYEQLNCIGYDANADALMGIIHIKKTSGYSGGLCSAGSLEHVAWWLDWGDGAGWQYAGTSSVRVYDITSLPSGGLHVAVYQPVNTLAKRKNCSSGPVIPKIRAILSWQTPPSTTNPNWVPVWGSREETTSLLSPGALANFRPIIESVGSVAVCNIDPGTGKTYAPHLQPFGGVLTITGIIPSAPDVATPIGNKLRYRVQVRELPGGAWQTVANSFGIMVTEKLGAGLPTQFGITQSVDADGYYTYQEDMDSSGAGWRLVQNRVLAQWITAKPMHGRYEIKVDVLDPVTNTNYPAQGLICGDGPHPANVRVYLDEEVPDCGLTITGFSRNGGPIQPAAACGTFQVGDVLHGTYSVSDEHFSHFALTVEPAAQANGATPTPSFRGFPTVPSTGENGTWTLNTAVMEACGYVLRLDVRDRTIQGGGGWHNHISVGFCLKKP